MAVRKLPVLQGPTQVLVVSDGRTPRQWVLIGMGFVAATWLPLAAVVSLLAQRWAGTGAAGAAAAMLAGLASFGLAGFAGGALMVRFLGRAQPHHALLSGALAAGLVWVLALLGGSFGAWLTAALALALSVGAATAGAGLGAWLLRRR